MEERHGMTAFELKNELCGNISEEEWAALEAGEGLYINDHNRSTMLRMRDWSGEDKEVPEPSVRELSEDLSAYLSEYMGDHPEAHKWIIMACIYLTFMERIPMHPKSTGWEYVDGRYVCPHCVPDSIICGYCMCEPMEKKG